MIRIKDSTLPSGFGPGQDFCITVRILVHDHQSEGFHLLPSQHLSEQQPSLPSDELSPQQQETPPLQGPLPRSAPPAETAVEAGRGNLLLLPHRKTHSSENMSPCPHMKQMTTHMAN